MRSARAAAMSPIRCGCCHCRRRCAASSTRGTFPPAMHGRCSRRRIRPHSPPKSCAAGSMSAPPNGSASGAPGGPAGAAGHPPPPHPPAADTLALERELGAALGLRVTLEQKKRGGSLTLHYASLDQLDRILRLLRPG